jgi:hypothetical protein
VRGKTVVSMVHGVRAGWDIFIIRVSLGISRSELRRIFEVWLSDNGARELSTPDRYDSTP